MTQPTTLNAPRGSFGPMPGSGGGGAALHPGGTVPGSGGGGVLPQAHPAPRPSGGGFHPSFRGDHRVTHFNRFFPLSNVFGGGIGYWPYWWPYYDNNYYSSSYCHPVLLSPGAPLTVRFVQRSDGYQYLQVISGQFVLLDSPWESIVANNDPSVLTALLSAAQSGSVQLTQPILVSDCSSLVGGGWQPRYYSMPGYGYSRYGYGF
jgi:hypothetical protein